MPDTEREIFDQATARETPAEKPADKPEKAATEQPSETPADTSGQERDEHGRFKAKAETPEPTPAAVATTEQPAKPPDQPQADHRIPLAEHLSEREKRQAAEARATNLERELQALGRRVEELSRPKTEPPKRPDPWADPGVFAEHVAREQIAPVQQQQDAMIERFSRLMAVQVFGKQVVDDAYAALEAEVRANPTARYEAQRIWQSEHPYGSLVDWHKNQKALKEFGTDPAAYKTRIVADLLKDPEHRKAVMAAIEAEAKGGQNGSQQNGQARPTNVTRLPPSLNRVASAQPTNSASDGDLSDAELFRSATKG